MSTPDSAALTAPPTTSPPYADGPLDEVCGDSIVIQVADYPEVGMGPLYALLGSSPNVNIDRQTVSGPLLRSDGTVEDVTLEVRSGGPAVGFRSPVVVMAQDATVDLAVGSMAVAVRDRDALLTHAVASLTDRSTDAVILDPETFPDIADFAGLDKQAVPIRHITDAPVIRYLVSTGVLTPDRLVAGSDGLPASFVEADGAVAQQGDLTIDPVLLPTLQQWGRPVSALAAADAGWRSLDDLLLIDPAGERLAQRCLGRLVRVIQQSIAAYTAEPSATNLVMSNIRAQFNPLSRLTPPLFDSGTQLAIDDEVFATDRSDAPGTIAVDGLEAFLAELSKALDVDVVTVDELVDASFVDPSISR